MTAPPPPDLACFDSLAALHQADLRDVAAAVLWVGCAARLHEPIPRLDVGAVHRWLAQHLPELRRVSFLQQSPHARPVLYIIYEAVQVLEQHGLVLRRYRGVDHTHEEITMTRRGRAVLLGGDIRSFLTRA